MPTFKRELAWLQDPSGWGLETMDARWLVLAVGLVLVLFGSRTYKLLLVSPGLIAGVLLAMEYSPTGDQLTKTGIAIGAGLVGALLMLLVEQIALSSVGAAVTGGLALGVAPLLMTKVEWYVPTIAALVGAIIFPMVYRRSLRLITPAVGSLAVAFALQRPWDLWLVGGLFGIGVLLQHTLTGKKP